MPSAIEPILDDAGLRRLLKFPDDVDLAYYRNRCGLPYSRFTIGGVAHYRYCTDEVMAWFRARQHNLGEEG